MFSHPKGETLDVFEFIARVLTQIPEPRKHNIHYFGLYSSRYRSQNNEIKPSDSTGPSSSSAEPRLSTPQRAALRKRWADLIRRVYQADPMLCECGGNYRVISFITESKVIRKILDHLNNRQNTSRAPPPTKDTL